ncbi:uncharacterized protein LOC106075782 [Biomphalaria glabrata]|uniref:Uncharacterized protein LOC106075782 n=1 Tax=Biomphalaria glabrata TaxID=6526 RepID=A0A9W2Z101_BIOGL|nr:uncharacterized protein LOC106075782 [Biomphalaria glabrata]
MIHLAREPCSRSGEDWRYYQGACGDDRESPVMYDAKEAWEYSVEGTSLYEDFVADDVELLQFNENRKESSARSATSKTTSEEGNESSATDLFDLRPSSKIIDKVLFIWHTALMMACLFLILIGILLRFHFTDIVTNSVKSHPAFSEYEKFVIFRAQPKEFIFGDLTQTLGNALIVLNSVHILCTMMYMSFQIHQNQFTLPLVSLVSGTIVLMEVTVTNIYMDETSAASIAAKKQLQGKLKDVYLVEDSSTFSVTYDILALWGQCCGITEKYNFAANTNLKFSLKTDSRRRTIQYPPTCCNVSLFLLSKGAFEAVKECAMTGEGTYSEGCYFVLYNWLNNYCGFYSIATLLQLFDMFIHILLYHKLITVFGKFAETNASRP